MPEQQLDLFSDAGARVQQDPPREAGHPPAATDMDDAALIAAIPESSLAGSSVLAAEAGRRRATLPLPARSWLRFDACRRIRINQSLTFT